LAQYRRKNKIIFGHLENKTTAIFGQWAKEAPVHYSHMRMRPCVAAVPVHSSQMQPLRCDKLYGLATSALAG